MSVSMSTRLLAVEKDADSLLLTVVKKLSGLLSRFPKSAFTRSRNLRFEERLALGPKTSLTVVSCYGQRFLVASSANDITSVIPLMKHGKHIRKGNPR